MILHMRNALPLSVLFGLFAARVVAAAAALTTGPWQQNVYTNRFTIMCETKEIVSDLTLQYGGGYGSSVPMTYVDGDSDGTDQHYIYRGRVDLNGCAGQDVPYRIVSGGTVLKCPDATDAAGTVRLWRDDPNETFSVALWSDNQVGAKVHDYDYDRFVYIGKMFDRMVAHDVDFGITTGDMTTSGGYLNQTRPCVLDGTNKIFGRTRPYYLCWGNHDDFVAVDEMNKRYFETGSLDDSAYQSSERGAYYFYRGNVLFIFLHWPHDNEVGDYSVYRTWLANLLATPRAKAAKFRLLFTHKPMFLEVWGTNSDRSLYETAVAGGVDMVVSGHMHGYERIVTDRGLTQLVNGGMGALDHKEPVVNNYGDWTKMGGHRNIPFLWARASGWMKKTLCGYFPVNLSYITSYCEMTVDGGELRVQAHGFCADGTYVGVFDDFTLVSKTDTTPPTPVPPVTAACPNPSTFDDFTGKPVTNAKWKEYKDAVGESFAYASADASKAVVNVSRDEIGRFCAWLNNGASGVAYRLPTETELRAKRTSLSGTVTEWTSTVDADTGWCRILGGNSLASNTVWTSSSDKPAIAAPACHANYLGFRLVKETGTEVVVHIRDWTGKQVQTVRGLTTTGTFTLDAADYFNATVDYVTAFDGGTVSAAPSSDVASGSVVTWTGVSRRLETEIFVQPRVAYRNFSDYRMGDPWVVKNPTADVWYVTSTKANVGLSIYKTTVFPTNQFGYSRTGYNFRQHPQDVGAYTNFIWAPEMHFIQGKWYAYLSASSSAASSNSERPFVLRLDGDDPYSMKDWAFGAKLVTPGGDRWAIDGTILDDSAASGKLYYVWSGWPGTANGVQNLYIAEMSSPTSFVQNASRILLSTPTEPWETLTTSPCTVNEGPVVLRHGNAVHIVYSCNGCWTDDYSLALLTCTDGDFMNPSSWTKSSRRLFVTRPGAYGPGHCSFTRTADGRDMIVYHAKKESGHSTDYYDYRDIRMQPIAWHGDEPVFGAPRPYDSTLTRDPLDLDADYYKKGPDVPTPVDPTQYGATDTKPATYTWKGGDAPWEYTTSWTATANGTYGIPNGTKAQALFPASLTDATRCTVSQSHSVSNVMVESPNVTLALDNATLTAVSVDSIADYNHFNAFCFANVPSGDATLVLQGANAGILATRYGGTIRIGYQPASGATGVCTVRLTVPASGWTTAATAPLFAKGDDATVRFGSNVKFDIDATVLGLPAAGETKTVYLATCTDGIRCYGPLSTSAENFVQLAARSQVVCTSGAKWELKLDGNYVKLLVTNAGLPPEPVPDPRPVPISPSFDAEHTILCFGDSLTEGTYAREAVHASLPNYFDGRLDGVSIEEGYPYWLSTMATNGYNVIAQALAGASADIILGWQGASVLLTTLPLTLPAAANEYVPLGTNLLFNGNYGGYMHEKRKVAHYFGFLAPLYPLIGAIPHEGSVFPGASEGAMSGWLNGVHVRIKGRYPAFDGQPYQTICRTEAADAATAIPLGTRFISDAAITYSNAVQVICAGANDGVARMAEYVFPLLDEAARIAPRHLFVSPVIAVSEKGETRGQTADTEVEKGYAARFGDRFLNSRQALRTRGLSLAVRLGLMTQDQADATTWDATDGSGLFATDNVHLNTAGYAAKAYFVYEKLVQLGYVQGALLPEVYDVTLESLLDEMCDSDAATRLATNAWTGRLWSSYDRRSVSADDPATWFANSDRSNFVATNRIDGRTECVMVDAQGPGALTRLWTANGYGTVYRFYVDGATTPVITGVGTNLIGGHVLCEAPLADEVSPLQDLPHRAQNLYLPIPFEKSLVVTAELKDIPPDDDPAKSIRFWYNAEVRSYAAGTHVESFSSNVLARAQGAIAAANAALRSPPEPTTDEAQSLDGALAAGASRSVTFSRMGAVRSFALKLSGDGEPLRTVRVKIAFDGETTVDASVGQLFGAGYAATPFATVNGGVASDGTLTLRQVMPFATSCTVTLTNTSASAACTVSASSVAVGVYAWDVNRSLHFGALGFEEKALPTRRGAAGYYDLNWVRLEGRGCLVGNTLALDNSNSTAWWGEGDEKIYVDGETFPSYFGTGTEDFFGYAWSSGVPFSNHPFLSLPLAGGTLTDGRRLVTTVRTRRLDVVPFATSLKLDVEVWHAVACTMDYAPATFWYARPGVVITPGGLDPEPEPPVVDPTKYGAKDSKASTYTWKGFSGPWNFTTNWTPSADATYGIPNHATFATADFPATLANAFTCTVTNNMTVKLAKFDAPNMTLVLDNASLTFNSRLDSVTWGAFNFGNSLTGDSAVEIKGAKAALVATKESVRANFGAQSDGATGVCTVRFVVPKTGWETTAPIRTTKYESKVCFSRNARFDIDATALGVPNEGKTKSVKLAQATEAVCFWDMGGATDAENLAIMLARSTVVCADGAMAAVTIEGLELVLTVSAVPSNPYYNETTGESFPTAQAALDAAKPGDVVTVTVPPSEMTTVRMKPGVTIDTQGFPNVSLVADPWFTVERVGTSFMIVLNDRAVPTISDEGDVPGMEIVGTTVRIHAKPLCSNLWYGVGLSASPNGPFEVGHDGWRQLKHGDSLDFELSDQSDAASFYQIQVKDVP